MLLSALSSVRRPLVAVAVLCLAGSLGTGSALAPVQAEEAGPTNAAAVFKWGTAAWGDEFHSPEPLPGWVIDKPAKAANQNGMLTLESRRGGTVTATASDQSAREGRWEARVRARSYGGPEGAAPYQAIWELVPAITRYQCGGKSIVLASYHPDGAAVSGAVRTMPDREFSFGRSLDLGTDVFHTYAVEVTDDHVSWFVDTQVVHTERRPEALSGVKLMPRLRLQATRGAVMDHARMQLDWVRYYTMARPNQRSIEAPEMTAGTYAGACRRAASPTPTEG